MYFIQQSCVLQINNKSFELSHPSDWWRAQRTADCLWRVYTENLHFDIMFHFVNYNLWRSMICQLCRCCRRHCCAHQYILEIIWQIFFPWSGHCTRLFQTIEAITSSKTCIYKITCYNTIKYWMHLAFERLVNTITRPSKIVLGCLIIKLCSRI